MRELEVCKLDQLKNRKGFLFIDEVEETEIAIFKSNNKIFAVSNICPHQHAPAISDGFVDENNCVTCPLHNWTFSLETGLAIGGVAKLKCYETIIEDNSVKIILPEENRPTWMDF